MLSRFSVQKPLTVFVSVLMVIILGCVSFFNMTPDLLPDISLPYALVVTTSIGSTPEEVEADVTKPLEQAFASLEDINSISSTSSDNVSMIILEFGDDADMDIKVSEIREQINSVSDSWDEMVSTPYIMKIDTSLVPVNISSVSYEGYDSIALTEFIYDEILTDLEGISGVASVDISGAVEEEVSVIISQEKIDEINEIIAESIADGFAEAEEELNDASEQLSDGMNEIDSQLAELESALDALTEAQDLLLEQTSSATAELVDQKIELENTITELNATREELVSMISLLETARDYLADIITQFNGNYDIIEQGNADLVSLNALLELYEEKELLNQEILNETDEAILAELNAELVILESDILIKEAELIFLGYDVNDLENEISTVTSEIASAELKITALDLILEQLGTTSSDMGSSLDDLNSQIDELYLSVEMIDDTLVQLEYGSTSITDAMAELNMAQIAGVLEISDGTTQILIGQSALLSAEAELESAEAELESAEDEIEDMKEAAFESGTLEITMDMISQLLTAQDFSMPAGYITEDGVSYLVRVGYDVESLDEFSNLPLLYLGIDGTDVITLSDVADVFITDNSADVYNMVNGDDGIFLSFNIQSSYATKTVSENVQEKLAELEEEYDGLSFASLSDQGDYIDIIIDTVMSNMVLGGILAILVLIFFLKDIRPTIVIAVSIPISILFAIVLMYFSGVGLNIISMSGLAVGVGMLVDNSVVVIENIYRMRAKGMSALKASVQGAVQVTGAITASTLTTVCVFLPIVFIDGMTRELFTDMALTVGYSLFASLIVSITLVPAMAASILKQEKKKEDKFFNKMIAGYEKIATASLKRRWVVLAISVVLLIGSTAICIAQGYIFMPSMSGNQLTISVEMPEDSTYAEYTEMADAVYEKIKVIEEIETVGADISDDGFGNYSISMYVMLSDDASRKDYEVADDIAEFTADLDAEVTASSTMDISSLISSSGSGVSISIYGQELDDLIAEAESLAEVLWSVEGVSEVSTGLEDSTPEYTVVIDPEKAIENGMTVAEVYLYVASELTTEYSSGSVVVENGETDIVIYKDESDSLTVSDLYDLEINYTNTMGTEVNIMLTDIAEIEETTSLTSISRVDQKRVLTVTASVADDYNVTLVTSDVEDALEDYEAISGNVIVIGGESEAIMEALIDLVYMLLLAVVIIYFIMVSQFQSFKSPFIVMFTIPLAFTGGFIALLLTGQEISVISMVGFVMLSGIIVNNGIVLIDYINYLRLEGMEKKLAIVEAGKTRLRPILMTALTTVLGLLFMALGTGMGAEMMQPVAIVCIGGLIYATIMTLFVVPAMYDILSKEKMEKRIVD